MSTKNNDLSRITIDMPKMDHKRLKALAAYTGKSMREMVLEFIEHGISEYQEQIECSHSHVPNESTIKAIKDAEKEENLVRAKDAKDLFKKLGIKC